MFQDLAKFSTDLSFEGERERERVLTMHMQHTFHDQASYLIQDACASLKTFLMYITASATSYIARVLDVYQTMDRVPGEVSIEIVCQAGSC